MKKLILLFLVSTLFTFAADRTQSAADHVQQTLSNLKSEYQGLSTFGPGGVATDLFGGPMPEKWFYYRDSDMVMNAGFHTPSPLSLHFDGLKSQQATLITLTNERTDSDSANNIVVRVTKENGDFMRYLVSVPAREVVEFHLADLDQDATIEAYSSFPFRAFYMNAVSFEGGEMAVSDATVSFQSESTTTNNALQCFSTNDNVAITVKNVYGGGTADAWFKASWYQPGVHLYQNIDVFYPTKYAKFHGKDKIDDPESECLGFAPNTTKSFTKNQFDSKKIHYWKDLAMVFYDIETKDVVCYGSRFSSHCWDGSRQAKFTYYRR